MPTIDIADKTTLDEVNAKVSTINTGTSGIDTKLGTSSDAVTKTSIYGKINSLINKVGSTSDTGGGTAAGSLMAKLNNALNKLLDLVNNVNEIKGNTPEAYLTTSISGANSAFSKTVEAETTESVIVTSFTPSKTAKYRGYISYNRFGGSFSGTNNLGLYISTIPTEGATATELNSNRVWSALSQTAPSDNATTAIAVETQSLTAGTTYYLHAINTHSTARFTLLRFKVTSDVYNTTEKKTTYVKSVQRGYGFGGINISNVNPNKCCVNIAPSTPLSAKWTLKYDLFADTLVLSNLNIDAAMPVSWEIVEFY